MFKLCVNILVLPKKVFMWELKKQIGLVDNLIKREGFRSGDPASRSQAMEY